MAGEGGHFSLFLPLLRSPPPSCPAPHVKRNIKGGVRLQGKVNGEGLKGSPLRVPGRPVHPRSSSFPKLALEGRSDRRLRLRRRRRRNRARRSVRSRFPLRRLEYKDYGAEGNCTRLLGPPPRYPTQCTSRLSPPPRPPPLQTLALGRWRTRQCSLEGAAVVAAPLLSMQQVPASVVVPHLPRIFRLRRCFSRRPLQHLLRRDHSLRLHKA